MQLSYNYVQTKSTKYEEQKVTSKRETFHIANHGRMTCRDLKQVTAGLELQRFRQQCRGLPDVGESKVQHDVFPMWLGLRI